MRIVLVLLLATPLGACTQARSATCKSVCAKEYDCVTKSSSNVLFDEKECIAACSVLESDPDNLAKVKKHADCVLRPNVSCPDVLQCD